MNDDFKEELKDCYAEIERLSEANEMMLTDIRRTDVDMLAFKAEIERLRAALREIASWEPGASAVARAALAEEKPND